MNLAKSYNVFAPDKHDHVYNIIGCGAVGSVVAEMLARLGVKKMRLYDFDTVESKNIANQMFFDKQIGMKKVEALRDIILEINPDCDIKLYDEGYQGGMLKGVVIMAVDSIKVRQQIMDENKFNPNVEVYVDFRMALYIGQTFLAPGLNEPFKERLRASMNFEDDEVQEERSACHETLSFCPTIRGVVACGIGNLISYLNENDFHYGAMVNSYGCTIMTY